MRTGHGLAKIVLTIVLVATVALAGVAWRLSRGPVDIGFVSDRIEAAVNVAGDPTRLTIGGAALAWQGFQHGADRPLELVLTDLHVSDPTGKRQAEIARAKMTLSMGSLLLGRIVPRTFEIEGARLTVVRAIDGSIGLDIGALHEATDPGQTVAPPDPGPSPLTSWLHELARPPGTDRASNRGPLAQLRQVRILNADITVIDRQLGATWRAPGGQIELNRRPTGGVDGTAKLRLAMGEESADLTLAASLIPGAMETHVRARLTSIAPAALARAAPGLEMLAALDAPVSLEGELVLGPNLAPARGHATVHVGQGAIRVAGGTVPIQRMEVTASATANSVTVESLEATLQARADGPPTMLRGGGSAKQTSSGYDLAAHITVDQLAVVDLGRYWPAEVGVNLRAWLIKNLLSGVVRNGSLELALQAKENFSNAVITKATGSLEGEEIALTWLRPVPGVEQGSVRLSMVDPDTIVVTVLSGRQRTSVRGGTLQIRSGKVRITGLAHAEQLAVIDIEAAGSLPHALALLREPRLRLLDRHPVDLRNPAGTFTAALSVSVPLLSDVAIEAVGIKVKARLAQTHLTGIAAGRDIDQGNFDLEATTESLTIKGSAQVAGIPAQIDMAMDFRSGPPNQVQQRIVVSGRPTATQLIAAGLDPADLLTGEAPMRAVVLLRRNGDGEIGVEADLTPSVLAADPIGWRKPGGAVAKGTARVVLNKGKIRSIDRIAIDGPGIMVRATADVADGRIAAIRLERAVLGKNDLRGLIRTPAGGPIGAELSGPTLDLGPKIAEKTPRSPNPRLDAPPGQAWMLDARFDRVLLAEGQIATNATAIVRNDGRIYRTVDIAARIGQDAPLSIAIASGRDGRRLSVTTADAGALLRGVDTVKVIEGGAMTVSGTFDDASPAHTLIGTAEILDFRVRGALALGKLLQAMTLYGLVDVLSGPGIGFSKLVAPLRLDQEALVLTEARAFSSSLGLTAKGRIDLADERADIEGTIVPAYFFNSLLGNIPLIGKLFSPEEGGGLFAARYTMRGKLDDPTVFVNPLSALTPGFLREMFGIF